MMVEQLDMFAPPPPATLAETLTRLSAHGWDQVGTRKRGMTTFYTFRRGDDENELAEGELAYWLADEDRAAMARRRPL